MLTEEITRGRDSIEGAIDEVEGKLREILRISNHVEELEACLAGTAKSLEKLDERYGKADPKTLAEPLEELEPELDEVEIEPTPPGGTASTEANEPSTETKATATEPSTD